MECQINKNMQNCNCTYEPCSRKGKCCECLVYHKRSDELPACCFPDNIEKNYDRSIERFLKIKK